MSEVLIHFGSDTLRRRTFPVGVPDVLLVGQRGQLLAQADFFCDVALRWFRAPRIVSPRHPTDPLSI